MIFITPSLAVEISPTKANLNSIQFEKDYTFFLTLINNENVEKGIEMKLAYPSMYLDKYVSFEPKFFKIPPKKSRNVKISMKLDESIPIGAHTLETQPISDGKEVLDSFKLTFSIPGAQLHKLSLDKFDVIGDSVNSPVYLNISLVNTGNTVEKISPRLLVRKDGNVVDIREYKTEYILLPDKIEPLLLMYDPSKLNPGDYSLELEVTYTEKTLSEKKEITLNEEDGGALTMQEMRSTNYTVGLIAIFVLALAATLAYFIFPKAYFYTKKLMLLRRIQSLSTRQRTLESTFERLMSDVMGFVEDSNKILSKYGEEYELK
ncbi:hypothetical protein COV93_04550 [Candidatus Woesearchaeota archaeon CG11_big_fil_rev_8_21_14_0_20_43_8]|nr:MAG: hypothetical protein COV93_04550 [Candidatus Woesearchaeota archaeon CG11_big_fil_rev_8_21_14_0_20_43_8]PIO05354.1 MAG: hypothetical protein COT47_05170 [Candidatus Woesearchaeota archaeon CG08_land_8_20_14_0_20_43_7]